VGVGTRQEWGLLVLVILFLSVIAGRLPESNLMDDSVTQDCLCPIQVSGFIDNPGLFCLPDCSLASYRRVPVPTDCPDPSGINAGDHFEFLRFAGATCTLKRSRMPGHRLLLFDLPLDPNLASANDLTALPGIGPVLAQRIVDYRKDTGRFAKLDDLLAVKGIGPKILAKISEFFAF
jgi:competence ComEA-like helix-hairpin-helix protein